MTISYALVFKGCSDCGFTVRLIILYFLFSNGYFVDSKHFVKHSKQFTTDNITFLFILLCQKIFTLCFYLPFFCKWLSYLKTLSHFKVLENFWRSIKILSNPVPYAEDVIKNKLEATGALVRSSARFGLGRMRLH